ncbi:54S ribosomal protein L3 mitochondrial [Thecaphora frezii]
MSSSRSVMRAARPLLGSAAWASRLAAARVASGSSSLPPWGSSSGWAAALHTSSQAPPKANAPASHLPPLARSNAALYAALRPPPLSAIAAVAARLHLIPASLDADTRARRIQLVDLACTHPSFQQLLDSAGIDAQLTRSGVVRNTQHGVALDELQYLRPTPNVREATGTTHTALATLGNSLLGMMASEFLHLRYPNLPTRVLKAAVAAYVGPGSLADVAAEIGLAANGILRWNREARIATKHADASARQSNNSVAPRTRGLLSRDVSADAMRALVAVMFQELGLAATRHFIATHLLSRHLELASLLKFADPKRALSATCAKYGRPPPQSRLVAESGRLSINPIFVVGVYSGTHKIGEGTGSAIKMAEYRAAEDALRRLYLAQTPLEDFNLPSTTLDALYPPRDASVFIPSSTAHVPAAHSSPEYKPLPLGACEVLEAAGKARH